MTHTFVLALQDKIKYHEQKLEYWKNELERVSNQLDVYPDGLKYSSYLTTDFYCEIPWDTQKLDFILKDFIERGWVITSEEDLKEGYGTYTFKLENLRTKDAFSITMRATRSESKCKVETIEYKEEITKYKYVINCDHDKNEEV